MHTPVYMYTCNHTYTYVYLHTRMYMYVCVNVYVYMHVYIHTSAFTFVLYVCTFVYTYILHFYSYLYVYVHFFYPVIWKKLRSFCLRKLLRLPVDPAGSGRFQCGSSTMPPPEPERGCLAGRSGGLSLCPRVGRSPLFRRPLRP